MKFEREEIIGITLVTLIAAGFFAAVRFDASSLLTPKEDSDVIVLENDTDGAALREALSTQGKVEKLIISDVRTGTGPEVVDGSRVTVNYVGMLTDGTEFDSSYERKEPYSFIVGQGDVIEGWDQGLMGMHVGGTRMLVVPAKLAYGNQSVGKVPAGATLLFAIELLSVE